MLSACSVAGPPVGGPLPQPADLHSSTEVILTGSAALGAPAGWTPAPTLTTPVFPVAAPQLLAAMREILLARPRTWLTVSYPEQEQAFFIVRSYMLNLPDIVVVQAVPASATTSKAVIFSRSRYDGAPFIGANKERVQALVKALTKRFGTVPEAPAKPK